MNNYDDYPALAGLDPRIVMQQPIGAKLMTLKQEKMMAQQFAEFEDRLLNDDAEESDLDWEAEKLLVEALAELKQAAKLAHSHYDTPSGPSLQGLAWDSLATRIAEFLRSRT